MSRIFSHRYMRFAAFALVIVVLLAITPAAPVTASPPFQEGTGGFLVFGGTVVGAPRLNVRDAPTTNGRILGKLDTGARVAVVGRSGGWYLIRYPAAPVGLAWVSSSYVQLDGQPAPVAARPTPTSRTPQPAAQPAQPARPAPPTATTSPLAVRVEAPTLLDFNNGAFRWQWYGDQGQLSNIDWYTDILLFFKGETLPYRTFVANPGEVRRDGPFFVWNAEPFRVQCDTVAVARIAVRAHREIVGGVSHAGVALDIWPACSK
ncbi:MAG: SH3 domain-containing protein, partial [Caldilinea sp.]